MNDRVHTFVGAVILATAVVSCVLVKLTLATPQPVAFERKDALLAMVPFNVDKQGRTAAWLKHECCACGSVHYVRMAVMEDEIEMLWWADDRETRKARWRKGLTAPDPWAAENDPFE